MANKEKIDYMLIDIRELENEIAGMRDAEVYPATFFERTFTLTHKILNDLHTLESNQVAVLRKQMENHKAILDFIHQEKTDVSDWPVEDKVENVTQQPVCQPTIAEQPVEQVQAEQTQKEHIAVVSPDATVFNDLLAKQSLSDFRKALSLNDRFRFRRELFAGDEQKMNRVLSDLNDLHSYEDSLKYLNDSLKWNLDDPAVADFLKLLEKRYL